MARTTTPEVTEPAAPAPAEPAPEAAPVEDAAQVQAVEVQEPAPVAQEKPDVRAILAELPDEEKDAVLGEVPWLKDRINRERQQAEGKALSRLQADQYRQVRANQDLQATLQNLDNAVDDNQRAQAVQAYGQALLQGYMPQRDQEWRESIDQSFRQVFGMNEAEYDLAWTPVKQKAARENRTATYADFLAQQVGEKFMPKAQLSKELREEVKAILEEERGKSIASQPSPVTLGPGESPGGSLTLERYRAMTTVERAQLSDADKDRMAQEESRRRGLIV